MNKRGAKFGRIVSLETRKAISNAHKGKHHSEKTKQKLREINTGKHHTEEAKKKMSNAHKGKKKSSITCEKFRIINTGKHHTEETKLKLSKSHIGLLSGKKHPQWKGGITPKNKKIRDSIEYRLWREAVFARDNWTCQKTGIKGGKLHAHHINNFAQYPELHFAINNGITFSEKTHREFHKKYGIKNNIQEQVIEFLKLK